MTNEPRSYGLTVEQGKGWFWNWFGFWFTVIFLGGTYLMFNLIAFLILLGEPHDICRDLTRINYLMPGTVLACEIRQDPPVWFKDIKDWFSEPIGVKK